MSKRKGLWWKIPLAAIGILMGISMLIVGLSDLPGDARFKVANCDNPLAVKDVRSVFDGIPSMRMAHIKLIDLFDVVEVSRSEDGEELKCTGKVFTNTRDEYKIKFRWYRRNDKSFVEVDIVP